MAENEKPKIVPFSGEKSERLKSAEQWAAELENELIEIVNKTATESSNTVPEFETEIAAAVAEIRNTMPESVQSVIVDPHSIQFHHDPHSETSHPVIAGFLDDIGQKIGGGLGNVESKRIAAGIVLSKWIQRIDPKTRVEFSTNADEIRQWYDRAILRMLVQK